MAAPKSSGKFIPLLKFLAETQNITAYLERESGLFDANWPVFKSFVETQIGTTSECADPEYRFKVIAALLGKKDLPEGKHAGSRKTEPSAADAAPQQQPTAAKIIVCRPRELQVRPA
ncbi:hypothetical protein [Streptomyces sp. NPDC055085]